MPRYFFHVRDSIGETLDGDGLDRLDLEAVREEALKSVRSLISAEALNGRIDLNGTIWVTDADGETILSLPYLEAFILTLPDPEPAPEPAAPMQVKVSRGRSQRP